MAVPRGSAPARSCVRRSTPSSTGSVLALASSPGVEALDIPQYQDIANLVS
jgi:hypothetical protein